MIKLHDVYKMIEPKVQYNVPSNLKLSYLKTNYLPKEALKRVIFNRIVCSLDYCKSLLAASLMHKLDSCNDFKTELLGRLLTIHLNQARCYKSFIGPLIKLCFEFKTALIWFNATKENFII